MYNVTKATVVIQPNDEANGMFRFGGPYDIVAQEGDELKVG